jgi:hypothetical protein
VNAERLEPEQDFFQRSVVVGGQMLRSKVEEVIRGQRV